MESKRGRRRTFNAQNVGEYSVVDALVGYFQVNVPVVAIKSQKPTGSIEKEFSEEIFL